jgi:GNAT superfamily N-acetyltransferase
MLSNLRRFVLKREGAALMRCVVGKPPISPRGFELVSHERFHSDLVTLHRALGRAVTEARLQLRFARGLRFYALEEEGRTLATTWAVVEGERFVDEIALGFPVSNDVLWWRDIFVAAEARGRGVFSALLDAVLAKEFRGKREMWSAVYVRNHPSMRAHQKRGFAVVCEYDVLHLMRVVTIRLRWPRTQPVGSAYQPERRLIWRGPRYRRFIADHLA